jgi:hypothetical protein
MARALPMPAFPATVGGAMSEDPAARAVALVERLFALLHECRALVPQLEGAGPDPEPASVTSSGSSTTPWSAPSRLAWSARWMMR